MCLSVIVAAVIVLQVIAGFHVYSSSAAAIQVAFLIHDSMNE